MGSLYRRKQKMPDGTVRDLPTIWIKYYQNRRAIRESTGTTKETAARRMLRAREGDVEHGIPITPKMGRITFEDGVKDLLNDYTVNGKKTHDDVKRRIDLHLAKQEVDGRTVFAGRKLANITTSDIRAYVAARLADKAAPANINRELAALKRMYTLAVQAGKLHGRPHIPMLQENNVRRGFFEAAQVDAVCAHLRAPLKPVVRFAYLTGWRVTSEILPLEWRQVDWTGRVVRLDPGTTKNREGRTFPFTTALEQLLKDQLTEHERVKNASRVVPLASREERDAEDANSPVFHRDGERIKDFRAAFASACKAAGRAGRILHDFRRTAVRNLERDGVSRSAAMAMVGHKTEAIYRRYAIVDAGALRDAAAKIDRAANG
jgi:integrase